MLKNQQNDTVEINIDDNVLVAVPDNDRKWDDFQNIPGIVLDKRGDNFKVGIKGKQLKGYISRNKLQLSTYQELTKEDVGQEAIGIKEAVKYLGGSGQGMFKCFCKGQCNNNKCKCKKNNLLCNSRCHQSTTCANK